VLQTNGARFDYGEPVSLQFAVLDYAETPHDYVYRPSGSADWIPLESRRDLTLFGLGPGPHSFEIRGRDRLGLWSRPRQVQFEVVPPFWMTNEFRALLLVMLAGILLGAHRYRTQRLRAQYLALQKVQDEREQALRETERRRAELDEAYRGLVHLTRRLESVKEEEREHLARELHDELGQNLTAAKIDLQVLRQQLGHSGPQDRLDQAVDSLDQLIAQVRGLSLSLRPPLLQEAGLVAALEHLLSDLASRSGLEIDFQAAADVTDGSGAAPKAVYRVVQEAVINALRHSRAGLVVVRLDVDEDGISVEVRDDGIGFDPEMARRSASSGEHLGLLGMNERVRAAGGKLEVDAQPGKGCRVRARVPLC
jgi:signal transduction histidine kinase